ncbi:MAG: MBL fold metallo-hydrolase, partial [Solobacterium sp.]|nr:MBL fold metallo-hydrolase [Solobacterium sp.]
MSKVRIFALGGLNEDGKNMYVIENDKDIFIIECGMRYPTSDEQLGVEMITADFQYVIDNQKRVKAVFVTHGHDDVMGALIRLVRQVNVPVYMAPLTARMFERIMKKEGVRDVEIHRIRRSMTFTIDGTKIRTFGTTQSIADGFGIAIRTEYGY